MPESVEVIGIDIDLFVPVRDSLFEWLSGLLSSFRFSTFGVRC